MKSAACVTIIDHNIAFCIKAVDISLGCLSEVGGENAPLSQHELGRHSTKMVPVKSHNDFERPLVEERVV